MLLSMGSELCGKAIVVWCEGGSYETVLESSKYEDSIVMKLVYNNKNHLKILSQVNVFVRWTVDIAFCYK